MKEARESGADAAAAMTGPLKVPIRKVALKIGRPGYRITKVRDPGTLQFGLLFQVSLPQIGDKVRPLHRFMSAYEQTVEPPSKDYQYLLIAAEPYETVAFKLQAKDIDRSEGALWSHWDPDAKNYSLQLFFKGDPTVPARVSAMAKKAPLVV